MCCDALNRPECVCHTTIVSDRYMLEVDAMPHLQMRIKPCVRNLHIHRCCSTISAQKQYQTQLQVIALHWSTI